MRETIGKCLWKMRGATSCTGYEKLAMCLMCGSTFAKSRGRKFCSDECRDLYAHLFHWATARRDALSRAHHKCEGCGISEQGLRTLERHGDCLRMGIGYHQCRLEVHHAIPVYSYDRTWHPLNIPSNLRVLCGRCHQLAHRYSASPWHKSKPSYHLPWQVRLDAYVDWWDVAQEKGMVIG
jgi:hypothetical protein